MVPVLAHPPGEEVLPVPTTPEPLPDRLAVDTMGGRVHVEWNPNAPVTPMGQLVFFAQYLQTSGLFDEWVKDCPWVYTSPNAPAVRDVLGTVLLSILAGHHRYAHVAALRGDTVNPALLGMSHVVSEDSVRRALAKGCEDEKARQGVATWQEKHLLASYAPLLSVPWILDIDSTIKTVYGHQEGAQVGYNPHKRGRPAHVYHTYLMGAARLVMDVEVQPGKQTAAQHALPGLWRLLGQLPAEAQPWLLRGDCAFGNEGVLAQAEEHGRNYLFKLRLTRKPKDLIRLLERQGQWVDAGQGWTGREGSLQLHGWSRTRRVIVLRRARKETPDPGIGSGLLLGWKDFFSLQTTEYDYAVLVTSLNEEVLTVAQLYRDRGDAENNFDELKNQWGWAGFTTPDLFRCQVTARNIALVYNWWSLFVRLADPQIRREAITSRPLLLNAVGQQTTHGGQKTMTITTPHSEGPRIRRMLTELSQFLTALGKTAEQLTSADRWCRILSKVFQRQLDGRPLSWPKLTGASG